MGNITEAYNRMDEDERGITFKPQPWQEVARELKCKHKNIERDKDGAFCTMCGKPMPNAEAHGRRNKDA